MDRRCATPDGACQGRALCGARCERLSHGWDSQPPWVRRLAAVRPPTLRTHCLPARGPPASIRRMPATAGASLQERSCGVRRARPQRSVLATTRRVVRTPVTPRSRLRLPCRAKTSANRASTRPGAARPPTAVESWRLCQVTGQSSRAVRAERGARPHGAHDAEAASRVAGLGLGPDRRGPGRRGCGIGMRSWSPPSAARQPHERAFYWPDAAWRQVREWALRRLSR
jgi:hypothetical protein